MDRCRHVPDIHAAGPMNLHFERQLSDNSSVLRGWLKLAELGLMR
jgi:hypothetical protein